MLASFLGAIRSEKSPLFTLLSRAGTLILELSDKGDVIDATATDADDFQGGSAAPIQDLRPELHPEDQPRLVQPDAGSSAPLHCRVRLGAAWRLYAFARERIRFPDSPARWLAVGSEVRVDAREEIDRLRAEIERLAPSQELAQLSGRVAHDFNNMLGAILAYTDLARRELPSDHGVQSYLDQVLRAGNRAKNLVRQTLTFSRRRAHAKKRVHLQRLANEVLELFLPATPPSIETVFENRASSDIVMGESIQLYEVLTNLIGNAIQAMSATGGKLTVQLEDGSLPAGLASSHAGWLVIAVRDTGPGMDEETRRRIFEPFFTTRAACGGTGLGLALVRAIVVDHGGSVEVESELGAGTTFFVRLPKGEFTHR